MAATATEERNKTIFQGLIDLSALQDRIRQIKFSEPFGTITNVAFLIVAVLIAQHEVGNASLIVASLTLLFIGSTAFHLGDSEKGGVPHWADVGFLYVVAGAMIYHAWGDSYTVLLWTMVGIGVFATLVNIVSSTVPVAIAIILVAAGIWVNVGFNATLMPIGLALAGVLARFASDRIKNSFFCDLLHAAWHVLIAAAVYTAWLALN